MPDADVESTVPGLLSSFFGNAGQRCLAGANLVMVGDDEKFIDGFLGKVQRATQGIRIGYGLEEGVQMGPLQAVPRKQRVMDYIEKGVDEGASLMLDGRKYDCGGYPRDCFLGPSIFQGVNIGTVAPMAFFPFSGMKDSFYGDLHGQGRDAVDFFTERKVVIQRWP